MKKFTKSILSLITICLVLVGSNSFAKANSFFESSKQKTVWNKTGFKTSLAKPDFNRANVMVVIGTFNNAKASTFYGTCTNTASSTYINSTTVTFSTSSSVPGGTATVTGTTTGTATATGTISGTVTGVVTNTTTQTVTQTVTNPAYTTSVNTYSVNTSTASTTVPGSYIFAPPTVGTIQEIPGGIQIPFTLASGSVAYRIYRNGSSITTTNITNLTSPFTDAFTTAPGTLYSYKIEAYSADGCLSGFSNAGSISTNSLPIPVVTLSTNTSSLVKLDWNNTANNQAYEILISYDGTAYVGKAVLPANNNTYSDNTVMADTDYWYVVKTRYGNGYTQSIPVKVHTPALPVPVITATAITPVKVDVKWVDLINNQGYEVVRSADGINYNLLIANTGANVNFFVDNTAMPNTKYWYAVRARFSNGWSNPSNVAIVTTPPLPVPTNVVATSVNCTQINLNWTDTSGPLMSEENFQISRSENDGPYALVYTASANATSISDNKLKPNTKYSYIVRGRYSVGYSDYSNTGSAVTKPLELTLLSSSATIANIKWGLCSNQIESFRVYISKNGEPATEEAKLANTIDNYTFKNLLPNTKYTAYITDITSAGYGGASNVVTFTTTAYPGPSNLTAVPSSTTSIKLNWKDNSNGPEHEDGFSLYKSVEVGKFVEIKLNSNVTEYIDKDLKANQKVCYYVAGRYSGGYTPPSALVCAITCPNAITEFTSVMAVSPNQIDLKWAVPTNSEGSIIVIASSLNGKELDYTKLVELDGNQSSYSDKTLLPNQKKYYKIYVKNEGTCITSFSAEGITSSCALAPTNVKAISLTSSKTQITWDSVANIKTYIIERSLDNIDFVKAGETVGKISMFYDSELKPSTKYYYRVSAKNEGTCTSATSEVKKESTATTCPAPPTKIVVVANSAKEIKVTFEDNSPDETGYEVEWSKDEKTWVNVGGVLKANSTALTISTGVEAETKYFFRVRATGEICSSDYSTTASVTTNPAAPTDLTAKAVKISQIDLTWKNTTKIGTTIEVQRASTTDNNFTKLGGDLAINLNTLQSTGLMPATSYKYRIRYASPNGFSEWSNTADATTFVISGSENESLGNQVTLYPVPTQNYLYLKPLVSILGKVNTRIITNTGATIHNQVFNSLTEGKTETINVSKVGAGVYYLEVSTQKGTFTKKFTKQ